MGLTLKQLIDALEEEGVVGDEAEATVEKFLQNRRARGVGSTPGPLAKRPASEIDFPQSPQSDPAMARRAVDYGDETPAQAEQRWYRQEAEDPDGLFGGGATAGGIFGDVPIATESYDPGARVRGAQLGQAQLGHQQSVLTIAIMEKMAERMDIPIAEIKADLGLPSGPNRALPGKRGR